MKVEQGESPIRQDGSRREGAGARVAWEEPGVRAVLDRMSDAFVALDGEWRCTSLNAAAVRFFLALRLDASRLLGRVVWDVLPGSRSSEFHRRAHEAVRAMTLPGEASWLPAAMPPIGELCSGDEAHRLIRGLALCHLDATLRHVEEAQDVLAAHADR